jgi:C-terminal peptidase prc
MSGHLDCFETVWGTVNEEYFDPAFGGLDWQEVHDRYQPQIAAAEDDGTFYDLLNQMLYELGVSHIGALPFQQVLERWLSPHDFGQGGVGVDVRWLEDEAVVTSVAPGSPAGQAGLRPGFAIRSIDGVPVDCIAEDTQLVPPYNERNRRGLIAAEILRHIYGHPGTQVSIAYADGEATTHVQRIRRVGREGGSPLYDGAPPAYFDVESKCLEGGIGYIRLSAFQWPVTDRVRLAIDAMGSAPGLILDLRGNSGGDFDLFIDKFFRAPVQCLSVATREGTAGYTIEPAPAPYLGPVVLLLDVMSVSAAELFAAALQATARGIVVGERSPGQALGTKSVLLPKGALFVYPDRQYRMPDGTVLEGRGVIPDIEVTLNRASLLEGRDSQLEAAIRAVQETVSER